MRTESTGPWAADVFPDFEMARRARRQKPQRVPPAPPCAVEQLEMRQMLTTIGTPTSPNWVLSVTGNSTADTIFVFQRAADTSHISVDVNGTTYGPYTQVNRVDVFCLGGNDLVEVETNKYGYVDGDEDVSVSSIIHGDAGDDSLIGGAWPDTIYGGYGGADEVRGIDGSDLIYGGDGGAGGTEEIANDILYGGELNDTLYGEGGNDILYGGDGDLNFTALTADDFLYGGDGNDVLRPENGADTAFGGAGNDTFRTSYDLTADWLDGGTGTDDIGSAGVDFDSPMDSIFNIP